MNAYLFIFINSSYLHEITMLIVEFVYLYFIQVGREDDEGLGKENPSRGSSLLWPWAR